MDNTTLTNAVVLGMRTRREECLSQRSFFFPIISAFTMSKEGSSKTEAEWEQFTHGQYHMRPATCHTTVSVKEVLRMA